MAPGRMNISGFLINKAIYYLSYAQVVNIFMNMPLVASKALPASGKDEKPLL